MLTLSATFSILNFRNNKKGNLWKQKTIGNAKTLTELLESVIEETENGNTIIADSLKKLCELCIKTNKMYQEQNSRGIAFEIMAKKFLSKE